MATVSIIRNSGTKNYSTVYAWAAAFASGGWEGDVYADTGEFNCTGLGTLDFTSQSTSATNYILLTTGPSQSFIDNSSVQTNALKYNASNGAALSQPDYQQGFSITVDYVTISKLQWNIAGPASQPYVDNSLTHVGLTQNIICMTGCNAIVIRGGLLANNLIYWPSAAYTIATGVSWYNLGAIYVNNTLAVCSDITNTATCLVGAVAANNATYVPTVYNNAVFGFSAYSNYTTTPLPGGYNGTSCSSGDGSTGLITSLTYGSQFVGTVSTAPDFRLKTGSGLIDAGYTASSYIPSAIDIVGTSRPQGSAWDIGAWELVTGGGLTDYTLSAAYVTFGLTGESANLLTARKLSAADGTFAMTGEAATLKAGRKLAASHGSFAMTGKPANLLFKRVLSASYGAFAFTGEAATLTLSSVGSYILTAAAGTFSLAGQAAKLLSARKLTAAQGSYALTGKSSNLVRGRVLAAAYGAYRLTGQAASFAKTHALQAATGLFSMAGQAANLVYRQIFRWAPASTSTTDWTVQNDNPVTWTIADD